MPKGWFGSSRRPILHIALGAIFASGGACHPGAPLEAASCEEDSLDCPAHEEATNDAGGAPPEGSSSVGGSAQGGAGAGGTNHSSSELASTNVSTVTTGSGGMNTMSPSGGTSFGGSGGTGASGSVTAGRGAASATSEVGSDAGGTSDDAGASFGGFGGTGIGDTGFGGAETGGSGVGGNVTGGGGAPELDGPPFVLDVGRLPPNPRFCWVKQAGTASEEEWLAKRELFQQWISGWQGASGLEIAWQDECVGSGATSEEHVRILLDDRESTGDTISGCNQEDLAGPWAVYPIDISDHAGCEWNMVLPFALDERRTVLHVAGHALGFSHEHLRRTSPAPDCPDELETDAISPYLASYDADSVMHFGFSDETAFSGTPFVACVTDDDSAAGLSAGDRLGIEMLYPPDGHRSLGGTGWLPFQGAHVFRNDTAISLVNAWVYRGASPDWFQAYFWSVTTPTNPVPEIFDQLQLYLEPEPGATWYIGHMFTDPFGERHTLSAQVEVSDEKHTAVLMSTL